MSENAQDAQRPSKEQVIYANILVIGVWVGIAIMFTTYFIYVLGVLDPKVPLDMMPHLWGKGVDEYLELTHVPHGWGWTALLGFGDYLNYVGFVLLALMTVLCYTVLVKGYLRRKDWIYAGIAICEILVLVVAASGLLGSGGH